MYPSLAAARRAFDAYARIEPELDTLWELCRRAAPPVRVRDASDDRDDPDDDPFDVDPFAGGRADEGWCAEDYFLQHVKSKLLLLVGAYRGGDRDELHRSEAYDTIYDLLLHWALARPCACCAAADGAAADDDEPPHDAGGTAARV